MQLGEIIENIFHINFNTQKELTSTFLRFQEFYESPEFKGKIFTLEEYKKWYISNSLKGKETGEFTYYKDWSGFNIPSESLKLFYRGDFDPLSDKERDFLKLFEGKRKNKLYIIGTFGESKRSLKHEVAHGLFYLNSDYRSKIKHLVNKIPSKERNKINKILSESGGYHKEVWEDETQAHIISGLEKMEKHGLIVSPELMNLKKEFISVFEEYSENKFSF